MASYPDELSLIARTSRFGELLSRCEITNREGTPFELESGLAASMEMLTRVRENERNAYVIGNGGSASIASHAVIDFVHMAKMRAFTLHDSSLLTCMANDYGYEHAYARLLARVARPGDILIAISSSGNSRNVRNAATQMSENGGTVMTLSGFARDNPLRAIGDLNIWLDASDYGLVEIGHQFVLHNLVDRFGAGYGGEASS